MEPNTQRIDKTDRVRIRPDADELKAALHQQALDRGLSPDEALAHAEETVARESAAEGAVATDEFGESMGENFVDAAVHGESRQDQHGGLSATSLRDVADQPASATELEPLPTPDEPTGPTPDEPTPDAPLPDEPEPSDPTRPV